MMKKDVRIYELAMCNKCGLRDWKIYLKEGLTQEGDGCLECDGTFEIYERFEKCGFGTDSRTPQH